MTEKNSFTTHLQTILLLLIFSLLLSFHYRLSLLEQNSTANNNDNTLINSQNSINSTPDSKNEFFLPEETIILSESIEIFIPTTICPSATAEHRYDCYSMHNFELEQLETKMIHFLSHLFGGAHSFPINGAWISQFAPLLHSTEEDADTIEKFEENFQEYVLNSPEKHSNELSSSFEILIREKNILCRSFTTREVLEETISKVVEKVQLLGTCLGQESMALSLNGRLLLLSPLSVNDLANNQNITSALRSSEWRDISWVS